MDILLDMKGAQKIGETAYIVPKNVAYRICLQLISNLALTDENGVREMQGNEGSDMPPMPTGVG